MAVVDPNPDWGKRPSAHDDQIQIPITVHVAGDKTQSAFLGGNA
jgi:D-tyrosyl-tRNA(Tyr) deacylase